MQEIEIKFLNINPNEIEKKLKHLGAQKISDIILEEWIFKKTEWASFHGRFRIRKTNTHIELSYKETTKKTSEGNLEIEFPVQTIQEAFHFIKRMDVPQVRHQQKRRIHHVLDNVFIDIDIWPLIPPMIEIEGPTLKEVKLIAEKLHLPQKVALDLNQIHQKIYGIDLDNMTDMLFTKEQLLSFKSK